MSGAAIFGLLLLAAQAAAGAAVQPDALIGQLTKLRLDRNHVYSVREIAIRRDVFSISLNRGTLAFTEPIAGKVTGAVFIGSGEILAVPPGSVEKQQLFRFTKAALLNERFEAAVFRFTDATYDEILKELQGRAVEDVTPEETTEIFRWDSELQRRSRFLNGRLLADLLAPPGKPLFLAQIEGRELGWFDAIYDERRTEEVLIEQHTALASEPVIWASFDKRSEQQDADSAARDKSVAELIGYETANAVATLKFRMKVDGERVVDIPVPFSSAIVSASLSTGTGLESLHFLEAGLSVAVVLPQPARTGEELQIQLTYATAPPASPGLPQVRPDTIIPLSYRDQWIIDGIGGYAGIVNGGLLAETRSQLLEGSPQGGTYESLGPISIGFRMTQLSTTPAAAAALRNKSVWVLHMLRMLLRRDGNDSAFAEMIVNFQRQYQGRTVSTGEFRRLLEKYAGQDLEWFFDQWVYGTGIPRYALTYTVEDGPNGFVIQGRVRQSDVPDVFSMPVPVFADDMFLGNVTVSGAESEFRFVTKTKPATVRLDPNQTILAVITGLSTEP